MKIDGGKGDTHFIASGKEAAVQTWRAENMMSGILGISYNISENDTSEHDIADRRFLKAGVMENGKYLDSEKGTPQ